MRGIHQKILESLAKSGQSRRGLFKTTGAAESMSFESFSKRAWELEQSKHIEKWIIRRGYQLYRIHKKDEVKQAVEVLRMVPQAMLLVLVAYYISRGIRVCHRYFKLAVRQIRKSRRPTAPTGSKKASQYSAIDKLP